MALPLSLRDWLVRGQTLNRPMVWGTALGLGVLGVAGWQYLGHPEWLDQFELAPNNPARPGSASNLSAAEQASLAEIDNLSLLLNQLQPETAQRLDSANSALPSARLETRPSLTQPVPRQAGLNGSPSQVESPFAAYLEQNQFRAAASPTGTAESFPRDGNPRFGGRTSLAALSGQPPGAASTAPTLSPLQQALQQQADSQSQLSPSLGQTTTNPESSIPPTDDATSLTGLTPPPWAAAGNIPGVSQSFIRTTPEMSPPLGTTGYTQPASLQRPGPSLALPSAIDSSLPGAAPLRLDLGRGAGPSAEGQGSGPTTTPEMTLPPSLESGYTQPSPGLQPSPFAVPRPPGSYTGGGFVYTFSDPNGPGN